LGGIPFSIICVKWIKGIDVREHGSKNAGATNVYRVAGWKTALLVLCLDTFKGWGSVRLGVVFSNFSGAPELGNWLFILGGLMAVLGHIFTPFAKFRGGKGVGPALGMFISLGPWGALFGLFGFSIVFYLVRFVSLASLSAALINAFVNSAISFGFIPGKVLGGPVAVLSWAIFFSGPCHSQGKYQKINCWHRK